MTISVSAVASIFLLTWAIKRLLNTLAARKQGLYPPGPRPKPFIGNIFDFPVAQYPQAFVEWEKKYNSPILHAEVFGSHILVINSLDDAIALFERPERARIYSDRPIMTVNELMGWDTINVALMPYGEVWRRHRKVCHQNFNIQAARQYELVQTKKVRELLRNLLYTPEQFDNHNKLFSVSVTISTMYGHDVESIEDPCVRLSDETLLLGSPLLVPGGSLINVIPALRYIPEWVPGAYSRKVAAKVRRMTSEALRIAMGYVNKSFEAGTVAPSLVTDFYEKKHASGASEEEEDIIKNIAYTVYGDVQTISFTSSFVYLMTVNPDVQRKAQVEIDSVIGSKRLPEFADRTTVFTNIWAMSYNEKAYPDPYAFKPERFLDNEGKLTDDKVLAYGFGRRGCVGKPMASSTTWIMMVSILAAFDITKSKDKHGNDVEVNDKFQNDGLMLYVLTVPPSFYRAYNVSRR
ncbi:hypothetical protein CVT25_015406 [Psilocybe cyanescens]|uniref:Cytochrome P450 n=1 Tax=Psilocybe cyanescens TaxID=93625 RepID=A0A409WHH6_PSICY|nr:hypothetical protein CVT25_015406 [Psilocybe cyanescens]